MLGLSLCIILSLSAPDQPNKDSVSRISNFECFNIVRLIEHEVRKVEGPLRRPISTTSNSTSGEATQITQTGKTADLNEIVSQLSKNCDRLVDTRQAVCKDVLKEENVKKIYNFIKKGKRPDYICSSIGYKRAVPSTSRIINRKVCHKVITLIKNDFNKSVTPFIMKRLIPGSRGKNATNTVNTTKLLEDPQTTTTTTTATTANTTFSQKNKFATFFKRKGPRVCTQFVDTPDYQQCLILSRIAIRAARPQIRAGNSSESICDFLENAKLIQLTDKDIGTISQQHDREHIQRNSRRENFPSKDGEKHSYKRNHINDDDDKATVRKERDSQTRPKIENTNNANTNTNTESKVNANSNTNSKANTESNTNTNSNTNANTNTNDNLNTESKSNTKTNANTNTNTNDNLNTESKSNTKTNANANTNDNLNTESKSNTKTNANTNTNDNLNTESKANSNTNTNTNTNVNASNTTNN